MTPHERKLKRAMKYLGKKHVFAKGSTLEYKDQGSSTLDEFRRRMENERAAKKENTVVRMVRTSNE